MGYGAAIVCVRVCLNCDLYVHILDDWPHRKYDKIISVIIFTILELYYLLYEGRLCVCRGCRKSIRVDKDGRPQIVEKKAKETKKKKKKRTIYYIE
jgi:hypothetical protein